MNILMFSINPLYREKVMGGAPKQLQKIACYLGELGHQITILCTQAKDSSLPFRWHANVEVLPILPFKLPFPQPYAIPAYALSHIFQTVGEFLESADRFYIHDGELLFPWLQQQVPTIVSLRDNIYPETLLGGFLFQGDALIAISNYSRELYINTMGRFFPGFERRVQVVHNGIDWDCYQPVEPREILRTIAVDPRRDRLILHPHRPEPSKGLWQTIAVVDKLVHERGLTNIKVLLPRWLPAGLSPEIKQFVAEIEVEIQARNLEAHFVFHDWIPQRLMPEYYSLGDLTLALGSCVESFGNVVYESLGCGTPAIAAYVSTHRELLPPGLLDRVHFDDIETATELAEEILRSQRRTSQLTLEYLRTHFGVAQQLEGYAEIILNARCQGPLTYRAPQSEENGRYRLAPWCYVWAGGIYHDFLAHHAHMPTCACCTTHFRMDLAAGTSTR